MRTLALVSRSVSIFADGVVANTSRYWPTVEPGTNIRSEVNRGGEDCAVQSGSDRSAGADLPGQRNSTGGWFGVVDGEVQVMPRSRRSGKDPRRGEGEDCGLHHGGMAERAFRRRHPKSNFRRLFQ